MDDRRLVGIDLGITSAHTVRVLRADGTVVCRHKAIPTHALTEHGSLPPATSQSGLGRRPAPTHSVRIRLAYLWQVVRLL
jgi:hypothetical protein